MNITKAQRNRALLLGGLLVAFVASWYAFAALPQSYIYDFSTASSSTKIGFLHIFDEHVLKIEIDPVCEHEVRQVAPSSPAFGVAYRFCDKRWFAVMDIDSVRTEGEHAYYTLKYSNPGEKGAMYREGMDVTSQEAVYNNRTTYTRTTPLSLFRYFTHR